MPTMRMTSKRSPASSPVSASCTEHVRTRLYGFSAAMAVIEGVTSTPVTSCFA
eukprot:CAMPEP_0119390904 /NCGR_PEP_ID=MMETSP1334-20130426/115137_1 /TAXON_ID=127549 /ORGANISM="Calcidiscus leptoporus, Strain RCC1130" /LENGTH=52 /DNA_ID=CAMNT_0007413489 /DNA_START=24 /DNA_END=179 /DNA_ORIENTATION=-